MAQPGGKGQVPEFTTRGFRLSFITVHNKDKGGILRGGCWVSTGGGVRGGSSPNRVGGGPVTSPLSQSERRGKRAYFEGWESDTIQPPEMSQL